jgi:hypothetical protein
MVSLAPLPTPPASPMSDGLTDARIAALLSASTERVLYCQACDAPLVSVAAVRAHTCRPYTPPAATSARNQRPASAKKPMQRPASANKSMQLPVSTKKPLLAALGAAAALAAGRLVCPSPDCDKSFSRKDALAKHQVSKHRGGPRRFICRICTEKFTSYWDMRRHDTRVHSCLPKAFMCPHCGAGFSQKSQLTMHRQRVHNPAQPPSPPPPDAVYGVNADDDAEIDAGADSADTEIPPAALSASSPLQGPMPKLALSCALGPSAAAP